MITLPKDWEQGIQVRDWMKPVNQFGKVAMVILALQNKDKQMWLYEESVSSGGSLDGMGTSSSKQVISDNEEVLKATLDNAVKKLIYHVPGVAAHQTMAIAYKDGAEVYEPITNDEWEPVDLFGLKPYNSSTA